MNWRIKWWLIAVLFMGIVSLQCAEEQSSGSDASPAVGAASPESQVRGKIPYNTPLARYKDIEIGLGEFFYYESRGMERLDSMKREERKETLDNLLRQMIFEYLINNLAMEQGFGQDEEFIARTRDMRYEYSSMFYTYHQFYRLFQPSDEELKAIYDKDREAEYFQPAKFSFRHIFIRTIDMPEDVRQKAEVRAKEALALIQAGSDFVAVAKVYSDSERKGEVVGPFYKRSHDPEKAINQMLEDILLAMQPNQVSDLITTKYGYEILKLDSYTPDHYTEFATVHDTILYKLQGEKANEWQKKVVDDYWNGAVTRFDIEPLLKPDADPAAVVAVVYGETITVHDCQQINPRGIAKSANESDEAFRQRLTDLLKYDILFRFIGGKLGLDLCYDRIERYQLLTRSKQNKTVFNVWWDKMLNQYLADHPVTEEEKKQYYQNYERQFYEPTTAHVGEMSFKVPPHDKAVMYEVYKAEQSAKEKAMHAIERVKAGEAFADVARDMSEDAKAQSGGDLGQIGYQTDLLPGMVARSALSQATGAVSEEPVKSEDTFYVLINYEYGERKKLEYDDPLIKTRLERGVTTQKRTDYFMQKVDELVDKNQIEILYPDYFLLNLYRLEQSSLDPPAQCGNTGGGNGGGMGDEVGFEPLFDAYDLKAEGGWIIKGLAKAGPKVQEDGVLAVGGWDYWGVISKKEFENFMLRFDVKFDSKGNSGVLFHTPNKEIYKSCFEIQLESGDDPKITKPEQKSGAIFDFVAPQKNPAKPIGEWNRVEIRYEAPKLWMTINGEVVQDGVDISKIEGLKHKLTKGHIAFQRNDFKKAVFFKNIRVKRL